MLRETPNPISIQNQANYGLIKNVNLWPHLSLIHPWPAGLFIPSPRFTIQMPRQFPPRVLNMKSFSKFLTAPLLWLALWTQLSWAQDTQPASWGTKKVQVDRIGLTIPEFCSIEKVTTDELCTWPIAAAFAPDGSLVVAESVWNINAKETVQQQLDSRPHRIVRLRDSDSDGKFDQRQVIADSMSFPEGILCLGKDVYVTAPPQIWKLSDSDGDGVCEKREVWFDGTTLTGCANDLHGPWLGPDGWIYWAKAAFAAELLLYVVHGWLHLAGYDDLQPARKRLMRRAEARALRLLGPQTIFTLR